MSNSENNTLIINNKNYEIDKIEICGKYNIELVTKNSNITLYLDLNKDVIASLVLNEKTNNYTCFNITNIYSNKQRRRLRYNTKRLNKI